MKYHISLIASVPATNLARWIPLGAIQATYTWTRRIPSSGGRLSFTLDNDSVKLESIRPISSGNGVYNIYVLHDPIGARLRAPEGLSRRRCQCRNKTPAVWPVLTTATAGPRRDRREAGLSFPVDLSRKLHDH